MDVTKDANLIEESKTPGHPIIRRQTAVNNKRLPEPDEDIQPVEKKKKCMLKFNDPKLNKWDTFIII